MKINFSLQRNKINTIKVNNHTILENSNTFSNDIVTTSSVNGVAYKYEYDQMKNVTQIKRGNTIIHEYSYDNDGRLTSETFNNQTINYAYDNLNNITSYGDNACTINSINQLIRFGNEQIVYNNGQVYTITTPTTKKEFIFEGRMLAEYKEKDKAQDNLIKYVRYKYDENNLRIQKIDVLNNVTTNYTYDESGRLLREESNGLLNIYTYDNNGNVISLCSNGQDYFYVYNAIGEIIKIIDSTGSEVVLH